ncbi:pentatricopeptide repeat-containing protein At4g18520, chloroplastic-like [Wolffia australiana]
MPSAVPLKLLPTQESSHFSFRPSSLPPIRDKLSWYCRKNLQVTRKNPPSCRACYASTPIAVDSEASSLGPSSSQHEDYSFLVPMIQLCSDEKELKRVHSMVIKLFVSPSSFLYNNLICAYLRFRRIDDARKLFDQMPERTIVSWTAILNGYQQLGKESEFAILFKDMIDSGVLPNSLTYVCILNFCSKIMDYALGRILHASIIKGNWRNLILDSALLYFYVQCGDLDSALALFDGMPKKDVVCFTTMISAFAQHGQAAISLSMFSQMQHLSLLPNEFTVATILKACGDEGALKQGTQIHAAVVKRMFKDDVFVGSSLVFMYAKCGEVADARRVFDQMPRRNTVTWTSMIGGYTQNGFPEEAVELFRKMKSRRIFANDLTVVGVLGALGSMRSLLLGKEIHALILKSSRQSSIHISSRLIWFYCQCGEYGYASIVLDELPEKDVIPWTAMITGHTNSGLGSEALNLLNQMVLEGITPNSFTYSSVLKACARLEDVSQGKEIHAAVKKSRSLKNLFVGNSLVSLYMKCGLPDDALKVFDSLPERNFVSWKAMIIGYAKNGLCDEALKFMYRMQAEGFEVDDYIYSTVLTSCGDLPCELRSETSYLTNLCAGGKASRVYLRISAFELGDELFTWA